MEKNTIDKYNEQLEFSKLIQEELEELRVKLLNSENVQDKHFINELIKKSMGSVDKTKKGGDNIDIMTSYDFNPYTHTLTNSFGFTQTYKTLSFEECREIARAVIVRAIVLTRQDQASVFSEFSTREGAKGWSIFKKEGKIEKTDVKEIEKIVSFIKNCGQERNAINDNFDIFLRKVIKDSLELDHAPVEKIRTRSNKLFGFKAIDGATIYRAKPYNNPSFVKHEKLKNLPPKKNGYYPTYCQVFNNEVFADFYPDELFCIIRNPSTDIQVQNYGTSELENLIPYLNWLWLSDEHNGKMFTNGSAPKGFFSLGNTETSSSRVKDFKEQYKASMSGSSNSHKLLIFGQDVKWNDMQKTNRDMEYEHWKEYLVKLVCSLYKIDPSEVGFSFRGSGVYGANDKEIRQHSKEKGLFPLLKTIENAINREIMSENELGAGKYLFKFVGMEESSKEDVEKSKAEIETWKTINQIRQERGEERIEEFGYDSVLNPILIQLMQIKQQQDIMDRESGGLTENQYSEETNEEIEKTIEEFGLKLQ
jgi:hypothetical protein